ncbi:hypothetical protein NDU88_007058 [Pleurodeles waltl]|uniref:Uncharacterized protein n=1 Tax=Pleurodeles waltl TaxID=8319 RepID=A0AAV7PSF2_PLEWA|nr:hypothetical protein NDU88_007058 [Pleurodeles waltl]
MAPATPGSQQDPDGPDVTRGAPRQGGQLNIQCSQRFQIESSNSAISDTGCLVKTTRERGNAAYLPIQESHGRVWSPAGRGAPAPPQSFKSRGAGRSESSGTAAATPSQVKGRGQAHRHSAIPGVRVPRFSGSPRVSTDQRHTPEARGWSRPTAPGSKLTSRGRGRRLDRPPAPPQVPRRPRRHRKGRCIGWWC